MHAHAVGGDGTAAQRWLDAMVLAGLQPDAVAFNSLCNAHAKAGHADAAIRVLEQMRAAGVAPAGLLRCAARITRATWGRERWAGATFS